jgi:hypothetical protein
VGSAARAAAQGISKETENSQFQIMLVAQDTIEVLEKTTQKRTQYLVDGMVTKMELCPTNPYLSVLTETPSSSYIYDLRQKMMSSRLPFYSDVSRWSVDGHITILSAGVDLVIVPTGQLHMYLFSSEVQASSKMVIKGHPLGYLAPLRWLDGQTLLYETGCCDFVAYGVLDLVQERNYFVAWCPGERRICAKTSKLDVFGADVKTHLAQQALQEVSFDFMNDVFKLREER